MEGQQTVGCMFMIAMIISLLIINPAAYGGAVNNIFGIHDMGYGQKFVGGLSGLALPAYLVSYTLKSYLPTPFYPLEHK